MEILDKFKALRQEIFSYFGYVEDWRVLPIVDARQYFWSLDGLGPGKVKFADTIAELKGEAGNYYENEIYTQRHLPKWVYRGKDYTMIVVDTHTDGNQFLQIFDNRKER
ncbi:MAG: hypothetical protein WC451_06535 [Patescibacteria group bacterium]